MIEPETNIVIVTLEHAALEPAAVLRALEAQGVRMVSFGARRLRAITHLDVDDAGVERAVAVFAGVVGPRAGGAARG